MDETCPRCGAALTLQVRRSGFRDWFFMGTRRGNLHYLYRCPACGLTGGYSTSGLVAWGHPGMWRHRLGQLRHLIAHYVSFHNVMPVPATWLLYLLVSEVLALAVTATTGAPFWVTGWAVPLAGWLALKTLDVARDPSSYRRHGTRREEHQARDLYVSATSFPLYVVPPGAWEGQVSLGGTGSSGSEITHVDFSYLEDALEREPRRGFEVVNVDPLEFRGHPLPLFDQHALSDHVVNFAHRFTAVRTNAIYGPTAGPRRVIEGIDLVVAGAARQVERVGFLEHPTLFLYHVPLPAVDVLLLGWGMTDDELRSLAARLELLEEGSDLFRAMKAADQATRSRIHEQHERPPGQEPK